MFLFSLCRKCSVLRAQPATGERQFRRPYFWFAARYRQLPRHPVPRLSQATHECNMFEGIKNGTLKHNHKAHHVKQPPKLAEQTQWGRTLWGGGGDKVGIVGPVWPRPLLVAQNNPNVPLGLSCLPSTIYTSPTSTWACEDLWGDWQATWITQLCGQRSLHVYRKTSDPITVWVHFSLIKSGGRLRGRPTAAPKHTLSPPKPWWSNKRMLHFSYWYFWQFIVYLHSAKIMEVCILSWKRVKCVCVACRWSGLTAAVQMKDGVLLKEWEGWKVGHKKKRARKLLTVTVMEKLMAHWELLKKYNCGFSFQFLAFIWQKENKKQNRALQLSEFKPQCWK